MARHHHRSNFARSSRRVRVVHHPIARAPLWPIDALRYDSVASLKATEASPCGGQAVGDRLGVPEESGGGQEHADLNT
jgi:hypothetical protein